MDVYIIQTPSPQSMELKSNFTSTSKKVLMNVGRNIISIAVTTVTTVFISKVLLASDYSICSVRSILTHTLVCFFVKAHIRWKIPNCFLICS